MKWYVPSFNGDFRLVEHEGKSRLVVHNPTPAEVGHLEKFLAFARGKGWTSAEAPPTGNGHLDLGATVSEAGMELVQVVSGQRRASVTAVKFSDGKLDVTETMDPALPDKVAKAEKDDPDAKAATTKRATPCCPSCQPGAIEPASEVLLAFLTPEQHRDWAKHRVIEVIGGLSGHRYLIAHRSSKYAIGWTRICFDTDDGDVLKFYDWSVPPEEEVLSAMLILQAREHWLRNEATVFGCKADGSQRLRYKNPFGDLGDGVETSSELATIGAMLKDVAGLGGTGLTAWADQSPILWGGGPQPILGGIPNVWVEPGRPSIVQLPGGGAGRVVPEEDAYDGSAQEVRVGGKVVHATPIVG